MFFYKENHDFPEKAKKGSQKKQEDAVKHDLQKSTFSWIVGGMGEIFLFHGNSMRNEWQNIHRLLESGKRNGTYK